MASLKEATGITSELKELTDELHSELENGGDFRKLVEIADAISRQADELAIAFAGVDEALTGASGEGEARAEAESSSPRK